MTDQGRLVEEPSAELCDVFRWVRRVEAAQGGLTRRARVLHPGIEATRVPRERIGRADVIACLARARCDARRQAACHPVGSLRPPPQAKPTTLFPWLRLPARESYTGWSLCPGVLTARRNPSRPREDGVAPRPVA